VATFPLLTNLNEHYSIPYQAHTSVLGQTEDNSAISQAPAGKSYQQQMAELVPTMRRHLKRNA